MSDTPGRRKLPKATAAELKRLKPIFKLMTKANNAVFRISGGRLGNKFLRGAPVGLLTAIGRKSGKARTVPLIYLQDGGRIVLVASQGGAVSDPLWYLNLRADPNVSFRTAREDEPCRARDATPEEKAALWPRLCDVYPDYADYQERTERSIPVVILDPVSP